MSQIQDDQAALAPLTEARLLAALDATWPAAEAVEHEGWSLRRGAGGGKRVSSATGGGDITVAETMMRRWGQVPMFQLTSAEGVLDAELADRGYRIVDPTLFYVGPSDKLAGTGVHLGLAYLAECRPAMLDEIWCEGGIGPARLAIMDRTRGAHAWLMSRVGDKGCGAAFVATDQDVAMIHAIEVLHALRRKGAGVLLVEAAARFALARGACWLALAVTEANTSARALYERLGMTCAGRYHYRVHPEGDSA